MKSINITISQRAGEGSRWVWEAECFTSISGDAVFSHRHGEGSTVSVRGGCESEEDLWVSSCTGCSYLFAAVEGVCGEWGVGSSTERPGAAVSRGRVGRHMSRDSKAIEARERPVNRRREVAPPRKRGRGRPRKVESRPEKKERRLARQLSMKSGGCVTGSGEAMQPMDPTHQERYKVWTVGERTYAHLKDSMIPAKLYVRG